MNCPACSSETEVEFTVEMMIHFSGIENIDNPGIPAFPKVLICLDCGFSRFTMPETELEWLATCSLNTDGPDRKRALPSRGWGATAA